MGGPEIQKSTVQKEKNVRSEVMNLDALKEKSRPLSHDRPVQGSSTLDQNLYFDIILLSDLPIHHQLSTPAKLPKFLSIFSFLEMNYD